MKKISKQLKKGLAVLLVALILVSALKFLIFKPKIAFADSTLGFNEGYGATVNDNNSNITGTITNAIWKQEELCKFGKCLYFDGTGDLINFGDDADLDHVAADNFTIEGWFRTQDITSGTRVLVSKYNSATSTDGGYKVYMDSNGYLIFGIDDDQTSFPEDSASTSTTAFDDNKWHHFAAVKTGTTSITLYVDGIQYQTDSSISATGTLANTDTFYVGIDGDGSSNGFAGFLDEVTVRNTARSSAEIKADLASISPSRGSAAVFGPDLSHLSDGLVGYWKMDETNWGTPSCSGTPILDSSGNNFHADTCPTTTGPTGGITGKFGNGGDFDEVNDYVLTGGSSKWNTLTNATISFWVKPDAVAGTAHILNNYASSTDQWGFRWTSTNFIQLYDDIDNAGYTGCQASLTPGTWYYITGTLSDNGDGTYKNQLYVNGVSQNCSHNSSASWSSYSGNLYIGASTSSSGFFDGTIDDVRIYNRSFSPNEISQLYNIAPSPVGYWKMDEGIWNNDCSTSTVFDSSTNGFTGKACPSSTGPTSTSTGKFGAAGNFDGTNDYVDIGDSFYSDALTVGAWVYLKSLSASQSNIVVKRNGSAVTAGTNEYELSINSTGKLVWQSWDSGGTGDVMTSTSTLSVNTWYYVAISYPGNGAGNANMYINGVLDKQQAFAYAIVDGTSRIQIGARSGNNNARYFNGYIDDAKIYNYARTSGQIIEDMNGGHPAPGSPIGSTVATWKMNEGYGTSAHDSSTNANDLTLSTASWTNSGKFGKAFNGLTNVRLSRTDDADLDFLGDEDFSFSLWFKSDSATNPSANEYLLEKGGNIATDAIGYAIYTSAASDGLICFGIDDDSTSFPEDSVCSTSDLYDNTWHHIVARKTGATRLDLYVDGKANGTPDTSISATGTLANASTFYIGDTNGTDGTDEFLGDIDEVQVYRSALSTASILAAFNQGSGTNLGSLSTDSSNNPSNSSNDSYCPPGQGSACTSPVAEWNFDENTGVTNIFDTSGNGKTGVLNTFDISAWTVGKLGSSLNFDGSTDYVEVASPSLPTGDFTYSAWVNLADNTDETIVDILNGSGVNEFQIYVDASNKIEVSLHSNGATMTTTGTVSTGVWTHIAVTRSGSLITVYINGTPDPTTGTYGTALSFSTCSLLIGVDADSVCTGSLGNYLNGKIDDIHVYNYARTPAQIAWDMNKGAPIGWWKLDECSGTSVNDSAGNITSGTIVPGASGNTSAGNCSSGTSTHMWNDGTTGKFNSSLGFDKIDDAVTFAADSKLNLDKGGTIAAWINPTSTGEGGFGRIVDKSSDSSATGGYGFEMDSGSNKFYGEIAGSTCISEANAISLSQWNHVAWTFDGTNWKLYSNGKLNKTCSNSNLPPTTSLGVTIGNRQGATDRTFEGLIDDVRLYNYPLTAQQIKTIANNGAAVKY